MSVLILGGTKGLGLALSQSAPKDLGSVICVGRSLEQGEDMHEPLGLHFLRVDLSNLESAASFCETLGSAYPAEFAAINVVFLVAGTFLRKPLYACSAAELITLANTNFTGSILALGSLHRAMREQHKPYHLVIVASTSSFSVRESESVYASLNAARAHFARNFSRELTNDLPGSKVTLVHPGGMKTPSFWRGVDQSLENYMQPLDVARAIWTELSAQKNTFCEFAIRRSNDERPCISAGPFAPEHPAAAHVLSRGILDGAAMVSKRRLESAMAKLSCSPELDAQVAEAAVKLRKVLQNGGRVFACGNGGSAADAQHFVAELVGRYLRERNPMPAMALTTNTSVLTAVGNDYSYDDVFSRQVRAWAKPGDLLLGISTSGNSKNVINAVAAARECGAYSVGLTGSTGGLMKGCCDLTLCVPSNETPRIQEVHIWMLHTICEIVEAP